MNSVATKRKGRQQKRTSVAQNELGGKKINPVATYEFGGKE